MTWLVDGSRPEVRAACKDGTDAVHNRLKPHHRGRKPARLRLDKRLRLSDRAFIAYCILPCGRFRLLPPKIQMLPVHPPKLEKGAIQGRAQVSPLGALAARRAASFGDWFQTSQPPRFQEWYIGLLPMQIGVLRGRGSNPN